MIAFARSISHRYSRQGLLAVFLICAFPLHFWTWILAIRDMSWAVVRTNLWDAVGIVAYSLVYALFETIILFCVVALAGLITPPGWNVDRRIALLSLLFLLASVWAMIAQLFFLWNVTLPIGVLLLLARSAHPLRMLYAAALLVVTPSILLPVFLFLKTGKAVAWMKDIIERLTLLSTIYLLFDFIGLIVVVVRNLT